MTISSVEIRSTEQSAPAHETPAWAIRRGDPGDYEALRRLYERAHGQTRTPASVRWLYEANPAGRCALWVAEDGDGRLIGARPVFPWRLWIRGQEVRIGQLGDAMTDPECRGRGVFTALVRAAWSSLADQGIPFAFSFSNPGSLSVYRKTTIGSGSRAGTHEVLWFQRLVRPLSFKVVLPTAMGVGAIAGGLDGVARAYLRRRLALPGECAVLPVHRFDTEFDELWTRARNAYRVTTVRDAAYLNWRFIQAPSGPCRVLGLRVRDRLVGYVAFELDAQGHGWIADVFGVGGAGVIAALVKAALAAVLQAGGLKLSVWAATANPCYPRLRELGFVPRGQPRPMAVHVYRDGWEAAASLKAGGWWAWYGDRDVERIADEPASGQPTAGKAHARVAGEGSLDAD